MDTQENVVWSDSFDELFADIPGTIAPQGDATVYRPDGTSYTVFNPPSVKADSENLNPGLLDQIGNFLGKFGGFGRTPYFTGPVTPGPNVMNNQLPRNTRIAAPSGQAGYYSFPKVFSSEGIGSMLIFGAVIFFILAVIPRR